MESVEMLVNLAKMMEGGVKVCKKCKYHVSDSSDDNCKQKIINLVTGEIKERWFECRFMRTEEQDGYCGPEGRLHEPK